MENKLDHPQSHEEREAETLVTRIEKQPFQEAAREAETERTLDDYAKTVGQSEPAEAFDGAAIR
jgi:hypothetical protein